MNILITGATGFIGSNLARRCVESGHTVTALGQQNNDWEARRAQELEKLGARVIIGSVLDVPLVRSAAEGQAAVFHLAAAQHESDVDDSYYRDINVVGTRNLLEASVAAGVRQFVHGSTIGVYGAAHYGALTEDSPVKPENIYGITKLEGEQVAREYRDRLSLTIVRISETYGPEDSRLLPMFRLVSKGWFPLIGSGSNKHQPIFVADLVVALIAVLDNDKVAGETIILAGPAPISTRQMIDLVERAIGCHIHRISIPMGPMNAMAFALEKVMPPLHIKPPFNRRRLDFYRKNFWFDTGKAGALLGVSPATDFAVGAEATLHWYVTNGLLMLRSTV
jgi:nucleoside-diphosphate-sugar epimerase